MRTVRMAGIAAVLALTVLAGCDGDPEEGKAVPPFVVEAPGGTLELPVAGKGKVTVVAFWASWCPPCRQELAQLQTLSEQWNGDLAVFAVNVGEEPEVASRALAAVGVRFALLRDPQGVAARVNDVHSFPHMLVFDRDGRLRHRLVEAETSAGLSRMLGQLR